MWGKEVRVKKVLSRIGQSMKAVGIILGLIILPWPGSGAAGNDLSGEIGDGYTIVKCSSPGECYFIISSQTGVVIGPLSEAALFRRSISIFLGPFRGAIVNPNVPAPVLRGLFLAPALMALPYSLPVLLLARSL